MTEKRKVIVDSDFMNYMIRNRNTDLTYYFNKIIEDLQIEPVIHEFLYNKELMANPLVRSLKEQGVLTVIEYDDYLNEEDELYCKQLFEDLYKYCNGEDIEWGKFDFRTYQESDANIGEIHSVILAMFTGYDLLFSNDNGAKSMVNTKINTESFQITVQNVIDVFKEIAVMEDKSITKKDFVTLTKGDKPRKESIREVKELWIGE